MSMEGNIKPRDERGYPGESGWEGSRAVGEAETVNIWYPSKISCHLVRTHVFICELVQL